MLVTEAGGGAVDDVADSEPNDGTPTQRHHSDRNRGRHLIHTGGSYDSQLHIPVIQS
jgi:hypothetical protein